MKASDKQRLLTTAEAARYLRVSEASIRRWSDSGSLRSQRLGGRRQRRFREDDLLAFMDHATAQRPAGEVSLGGVALNVPFHIAPFYGSDAGRLRLSLPFLSEGIRLAQPTFLIATGEALQVYEAALSKSGVDFDRAAERGLFTLISFANGLDESVALLEHNFSESLINSPTLIRFVGETASAREMFAAEEEFLRFEEAIELMFRRYPVGVLCQYDVRRFSGPALLRMLKAHPDMYMARIGAFLN